MQLIQIFMVVIFAWLLILTVAAAYIIIHFRRLSKGVGTGNLITVIDKLIDIEEDNSESIVNVGKRIDKIEEDSLLHIQKVGLVKFNPFQELGGDHSFSLALLDGKDNGFVVTGLHSRDRTRIYSKIIEKGKSGLELSKEEKRAVKQALK